MEATKAKLPQGFSYALKTSTLEKALVESKITTDTSLSYDKSDIFFDAHYWLPNENVKYCRINL